MQSSSRTKARATRPVGPVAASASQQGGGAAPRPGDQVHVITLRIPSLAQPPPLEPRWTRRLAAEGLCAGLVLGILVGSAGAVVPALPVLGAFLAVAVTVVGILRAANATDDEGRAAWTLAATVSLAQLATQAVAASGSQPYLLAAYLATWLALLLLPAAPPARVALALLHVVVYAPLLVTLGIRGSGTGLLSALLLAGYAWVWTRREPTLHGRRVVLAFILGLGALAFALGILVRGGTGAGFLVAAAECVGLAALLAYVHRDPALPRLHLSVVARPAPPTADEGGSAESPAPQGA